LTPAHFSGCREFSILAHTSAPLKQKGTRPEARNISQKVRWEIFARDNFTCKYCGRKPPEVVLVVDHVISVDANGTKEHDNLVTACEDCNFGKSNRPPPKL
jgi:5-methylcytosine-specific restriction endonuclease McrA